MLEGRRIRFQQRPCLVLCCGCIAVHDPVLSPFFRYILALGMIDVSLLYLLHYFVAAGEDLCFGVIVRTLRQRLIYCETLNSRVAD